MSALTYRPARAEDGPHLYRMVEEIGTLERNTGYCYAMMARFFANTCAVAEENGQRLGFVMGFVPPGRPDAVFVWQVGVHPKARGRGVATALLEQLLSQTGADFLEATVGEENAASQALFTRFARKREVECRLQSCFLPEHFSIPHEAEPLYRIGPLRPAGSTTQRVSHSTTKEVSIV